MRFLWDGDQPAEVRHYRHGECISRRHWVHNGWELLVQQRQITSERWETDFVTSDQNGAPQALYANDGTVRWQAPKATLWGLRTVNDDSPDPGLAFAGQYRDSESGLCYNRFRYYDPDGGCYISPDPIGVLGGESNYGYVHNPVGWVDPFGLAGCEITFSKNFDTKLKKHAQDIYETSRKLGVPVAKGDKEGMKDFILSIVNDKANLANSNFVWNTIESTSAYVKGDAIVLVNNATNEALTFLNKGGYLHTYKR